MLEISLRLEFVVSPSPGKIAAIKKSNLIPTSVQEIPLANISATPISLITFESTRASLGIEKLTALMIEKMGTTKIEQIYVIQASRR